MKTDYEKLEKTLASLCENENDKIVEGKRDKQALEYFGAKNIKTLNGKTLEQAAENTTTTAIVLTDYDRTGVALTKRLTELLQANGTSVDLHYRNEIKEYAKINEIEELPQRYEKMKHEQETRQKKIGDIHGQSLHRHSKVHGKSTSRD